MRYLIEHETHLAFPEPVREHQVELRLAPREDATQRSLACELEIGPAATLREHFDCFGNRVHRASLVAPHTALDVRLRAEVETSGENPFDWGVLEPEAERALLARQVRETPRLLEFVLPRSPSVPDLAARAAALGLPSGGCDRPLVERVQAVMAWAGSRFEYRPDATDVHAPLDDFLVHGGGVCQDFAHLLLAVVRSWGVPGRYVAGYVDPGALGEAAAAIEATHAWAEVWIPGAGWRGFDATSGLLANDRYVAVAAGRDSRDAAPVRGAFKGDHAGEPPSVRLRMARPQ